MYILTSMHAYVHGYIMGETQWYAITEFLRIALFLKKKSKVEKDIFFCNFSTFSED